MSRTERKRHAQYQYRIHRNLPVWELVGMENQGILNWRFRPRYIDVRVKRAIRRLQEEAADPFLLAGLASSEFVRAWLPEL